MATPLVIGPAQQRLFEQVRAYAEKPAQIVDITTLMAKLDTEDGKRQHMKQMNSQSVQLPFGWLVTYSVESGHPIGLCRHLSMSSPAKGRTPIPEAVWMVAEYFGFVGSFEKCDGVWEEELQRGEGERAIAINIVKRMEMK